MAATLDKWRKPPHAKSIGIELEGCLSSPPDPIITGYRRMFFAGKDGSIVPTRFSQYGIEWVSQPLTVEWLCRELRWLFNQPMMASWNTNKSCGIHLHVSRLWLNERKAERINKFLHDMPDNARSDYFGRLSNYFCAYLPTLDNSDRYHAVNISNKHTIEFRMFASGGLEWSMWCVRCVQWLIEHASHLNIDALDALYVINGCPWPYD